MKLKRGIAIFLSLAVLLSTSISSTVMAAETVTPIERVDIFQPKAMLDLGVTDPNNAQRHTHGPTITELPNGDLFSVWFSSNPGGERDANECRIVGARSTDKGATWGVPFEVYNLDGVPSNNPVIYVDKNDRLWLFYCTIINGQWVSAIPRYMYADVGDYEVSNGYTANPNWHFPEPMYVNVGDPYGGAGRWDGTKFKYSITGDKIRHLTAQPAQEKLDPSNYVEVTSRFDPNNKVYITDSFVVAIRNQFEEVVEYLEAEKPYDDATANRNDIVIRSVNEGVFQDSPYKSEPSLKDGAIWRASGADNDIKTWNPAYRRMGWQTKNQPIEITVPAGEKLSDGTTSANPVNRLLLPLYSDSLALSIVSYTDDGGKTWGYSGPIAGLGNIQGTLIQKNDGTIYQYFRTGKLDGKNGRLDWKLVRAESTDYGVTWGNQIVEPYLRNDGGVGLEKAEDGTWVMVHNQEAKKDFRSGTRQSVTLSISKDEGQSWKSIMLDTDRAKKGSEDAGTGELTTMDYQYPGIIQIQDGSFVSIYTNGRDGQPSQVMRTSIIKDLDGLFATTLALNKQTANIYLDGKETLSTTVTQKGSVIGDKTILWRTSDPSVLTVDENGKVTALKEGKAKIIASSVDFGAQDECMYTVVAKVPVVPGDGGNTGGNTGGGSTSGGSTGTTTGEKVIFDSKETSGIVAAINGNEKGITVNLTSQTKVAKEVFSALAGKDEVLTIKGNNYTWTLNGTSIKNVDAISELDLGVTLSTNVSQNTLPNGINKEEVVIGLSLKHEGQFPGALNLEINAGKENAGKSLHLYYIKNNTFELMGTYKVAADGKVVIEFTHASEYILTTQNITLFNDVDTHWAKDFIYYLAGKGVIKGIGDNSFAPNSKITRAQFVTILASISGEDMTKYTTSKFNDVKSTDWFASRVSWASDTGIISGVGQNNFAPNENITREQMAVMIVRFAKVMNYNLNATVDENTFADASKISSYAVEAVKQVQQADIIKGMGNNQFAPKVSATRAEACTMLTKLIKR